MRYLAAVLVLTLVSATSPALAQQPQTFGPEHKAFEYFLGDWTYELSGNTEGSGEISFQTFGDGFFLHWHETWREASVAPVEISGWFGYDQEGNHYTWARYFSNGDSDTGKGWKHGDTWVFILEERYEEGKSIVWRAAWTAVSPDSWEFTWERSVAGLPWELESTGKATRAD